MRFAASRAWKDPLSRSAASSVILAFRESWPLYFEIDDATGIRPMTVVPLPGRDRISREPLPRRGDRPYSADRFLAGLCVDRILGHRRRQEDQIPVVPGHAHGYLGGALILRRVPLHGPPPPDCAPIGPRSEGLILGAQDAGKVPWSELSNRTALGPRIGFKQGVPVRSGSRLREGCVGEPRKFGSPNVTLPIGSDTDTPSLTL
jgi:hypothetical protein